MNKLCDECETVVHCLKHGCVPKQALAAPVQPVAHCEAGPNSCQQCHKESRPTYGSEEVRKLREVIESQAKIIESNKPPPWFNAVENILQEYGLQAIDFVADFKAAIVDAEQPAPAPMAHIVGEIDHTGKVWRPVQPAFVQEPEIVQRVKRYAGQTMRTARNPNITARECIELANWIVATPPAQPAPVQETMAWRFTGVAGFKRFVTDAQHKAFSPEVQSWYEPFRCSNCTTSPAQPAPTVREPVPAAIKTVVEAMQADPDYAWGWHCNIAMAFVDAGGDHYTGNQGAARFMKMLADVEPAHELPTPPPPAAQPAPVQEKHDE
jgi:hypothetical protein